MGAIVNRDLSRRVRPVNGITAHKTICKTDIKLCAKIAHSLDEKAGLWNAIDGGEEPKHTFGLKVKYIELRICLKVTYFNYYLVKKSSFEEHHRLFN